MYEEALKKLESKQYIIKVANHNKYCSTFEKGDKVQNPINEVENNFEKEKKKVGRPVGKKKFEKIDLEAAATKTITNDIADELIQKGYKLVNIGEDISYLIDVSTNFEVIKVITPKYKREDVKDGKIYQALSNSIFPHSCCTPSLAADIINAKYNLDVPIYRYSKYLNSLGFPLSEMTLTNYVRRADEKLQPLYKRIKSYLFNENPHVIHVDETPIEVLDYLKNENRKNGYIFAYVSSYFNDPIYLYDFSKTRQTDNTESILKGYKGYLVTDGYGGYDKFPALGIKVQRCWAHIRRKFYDIVKVLPYQQKKISKANEMVKKIDKLFAIETKFKDQKYGPYDILEARQTEEYKAIVDDIFNLLHSIEAEDGTELKKAVTYFLNCEEESKTFLEDGHIPLSNNICERAIKPFAIMRRNILFAKTENGAELASRLFTIIQTARGNGLAVNKYLEYVLSNINGSKDIDKLLPWSQELPENLRILSK